MAEFPSLLTWNYHNIVNLLYTSVQKLKSSNKTLSDHHKDTSLCSSPHNKLPVNLKIACDRTYTSPQGSLLGYSKLQNVFFKLWTWSMSFYNLNSCFKWISLSYTSPSDIWRQIMSPFWLSFSGETSTAPFVWHVFETHRHLVYWPMETFQSLNDPLKSDITLLTVTRPIQSVFVIALM